MRRLFSLLLLPFLALFASAADEGLPVQPATLTPREISEGWILLFDGETTFGWHSPNDSKWTIAAGMLAPQDGKPGLLVTTTAFLDCEINLEYQAQGTGKAELLVGCDAAGKNPVGRAALPPFGSGWTRLTARVEHGNLTSYRLQSFGRSQGMATKTRSESTRSITQGYLALSGNHFVVRNVKLRPTGLQPIFNGKDLAGWKKFETDPKRAKSDFSVTKSGWLNVKNGPGDLQTEKQWADFVLQFDCRTNGDRLNSGVFFRCIPGEYQQGYEAQIHNGFAEPAREYTVEEYDPQTHERKDKKKVKSPAIDYGTGAIYRRIPARSQAAKDREWFTMTVVAQGRHLATWVNGIQQADWTDNRPLKDNARNGCRLEKGPISLQGHDPTTDLSFRNIRIADLAPPRK
jgi:hypothetical protein